MVEIIMHSITKAFCKAIRKSFPLRKQCIRKEKVMEYIEMLSPLRLELLHHKKGFFYIINPNSIEHIWKTFKVTEV